MVTVEAAQDVSFNSPEKVENEGEIPFLKGKRRDKSAPEGGWGYVVWFMYGLCMLLQCGELITINIIFNDYLIDICGDENKAFNLLMSTNSYTLIFGGIAVFMLNIILKKYTPRQVCIFGAFLQFCGDLTLLLMKSPIWFFIAGAVFKGISLSLLMGTSNIVFSGYFMRLRTTMMSLVVIFPCVGGMIFPQIAVYLMHTIGLRGCTAIMLAINLNVFAVACSMVEYRPRIKAKKCKYEHKELEELLKKEKIQKPNFEDVNLKQRMRNALSRFASRTINLLDLQLLKDPILLNIILGYCGILVSDVLFTPVMPIILKNVFPNEETVATIVSIGSGVELLSKLLIAAMSYYLKINNRLMLYVSAVLMMILRIVLVYCSTYTLLLGTTIGIAISRTFQHIAEFLVIVDYIGAEKLAAANSISQIVWMTFLVTGNAIVGAVKTNSLGYLNTVLTINMFGAICIIVWTVEFITKRKIVAHKKAEI